MGNKGAKKNGSTQLTAKQIALLKANTKYSEQEIRQWHAGFLRDCPNGRLDKKKFVEVYKQFYPQGKADNFCKLAFATFDSNDDGTIDFDEFLLAISATSQGDLDDRLAVAFDMYDISDDGFIDQKELTKMITAMYDLVGETDRKGDHDPKKRATDIISRLDVGGDKKLSKHEFIAECKNDPVIRRLYWIFADQDKRTLAPIEEDRWDSQRSKISNTDIEQESSEGSQFKYTDRSANASQIRPGHTRYERIQAPILSFDEEGDIPVPATKSKRFLSPGDIEVRDSRDGLTILKSGADSISIERTRKDKFRHALRSVSKVAFSQLGLGGLVVGYVILGGIIFDAIESRYELARSEEKERNRQHFVDQLYLHAYREFNRVLNQTFELKYALWRGGISRRDERNEGWQIDVERDLWKHYIDYELLQYFGAEEKTQYGSDEQQQEQNTIQVWTFSSAMLYSATVITTIGYGNITPKTTTGKIATMIYAMFGIPLMFMCLTYTGDLLADAFISVYSKIVNFLSRQLCRGRMKKGSAFEPRLSFEQPDSEREETRHVPIVVTLAVLAFCIAIGALLVAQWESWSVLDGAYFCFITFTTIGFGDLVPGKGTVAESKVGKAARCALFLLFGMIVMAMSFKLMRDEITSKFRRIARRFGFGKTDRHDPG